MEEQAEVVREKIESLSESLKDLEALREEVLQMQHVDFKKYADIIVNLQMKNDYYWVIKRFDDKTLDHIRSNFDKESGKAFMDKFMQLQYEAVRLHNAGIPADSDEGQRFANAYWDMITEFTGGDMSMLSKLMEIKPLEEADTKFKEKQSLANAYIEQALGVYFSRQGIDVFKESKNEPRN